MYYKVHKNQSQDVAGSVDMNGHPDCNESKDRMDGDGRNKASGFLKGADLKKMIIFSEILKPKFEE